MCRSPPAAPAAPVPFLTLVTSPLQTNSMHPRYQPNGSPTVYAENIGGSLDVFFHDPYHMDRGSLDTPFACVPFPDMPDPAALPYPSVPALRPTVDRFEELLTWAEERAAANGILPPYLQEGFRPASMYPMSRTSEAGSSSTSMPEPANECDAGEFDLGPLQAVQGP